ncbi:MAG: RNA polymerase sigma factor [Oscillochloris sp.]|nr:RNA polymerase sigma factor [Oscillochloris sp.]
MSLQEPARASASEQDLLAALRSGDEAAFLGLVEQFHGSMLRVAQSYVGSRAVAEEVVQETWLGLLQGLDRFEGRSSLKTYLYRILTNRARTRGVRENRMVAFSDLVVAELARDEPAVDPSHFLPPDHAWAGWWSIRPTSWSGPPEERLLADETRERISAAIAALPEIQRTVITLRDVEGWPAESVCQLLEISDANQRVLLHRARARVRQALEQYLREG